MTVIYTALAVLGLLGPTFAPTTYVFQAQCLTAAAATLRIGSGWFIAHMTVEPA